MKAFRFHQFGGPEVLQFEEVPIPEPGPGEVQVKVAGYGVNPSDWKIMAGKLNADKVKFPATLGADLSGTVTKLGEGVTEFEVGDLIFGQTHTHGAAAEYSVLSVKYAAKHPPMMDIADSAGLVVPGMTAWQALFDHGNLQTGQRVLLHAASGGVGSLAVQLAKWKGAYVIGTSSAENEGFVKELGADEFIDYTKVNFEDVVEPVDLVLDAVGGETTNRSLKALKKGGTLVTLAGMPDEAAFEAEGKKAIRFGMQPKASQLEQLRNLVEDDKLNLVIATELPLARTVEAIEESMKGKTRGKIIVRVS